MKIDIAAGFNISGTARDLGSVSMMRGDDDLAVTCVAPLLHLFCPVDCAIAAFDELLGTLLSLVHFNWVRRYPLTTDVRPWRFKLQRFSVTPGARLASHR